VNDLCYWLSQIVGSLAIGALLDRQTFRRRTRAFVGWGVLLVMVFVTHGWAYSYQKHYTRESTSAPDAPKIGIHDKSYAAHVWLYIFMGLMDAMWQTAAYWMMGAMSNDPAKLAHFTGMYKSIQSAGGAVAWRTDGVKLPFIKMFITTWTLLVAGLVFALPMLYLRVKDHTDLEDEALARMDDSGHIRDVTEVQAVNSEEKA